MSTFWQYFILSAPLFAVVLVGYTLASWRHWRPRWTQIASKFVFVVALPALLFAMLSDLSSLPPVDARLLVAFFGGCFIVFVIGRVFAARAFRLDGVSQSVFALGGVFSNNVLLGLPLARMTLGPAAVPAVALVLVFNALTLWTLVTVSVEFARHGTFTIAGLLKTIRNVLTNPLVAAIVAGTAFGLSGLKLPALVATTLHGIGQIAAPAALLALGMGLVEYGVRRDWQVSVAICTLKLLVLPAVVWLLGALIGLPQMELQVIVLLSSMAVGANVYLMSAQFQALQGPVASCIVLSTATAAVTTPILLSLMKALL